ncbi:PKD domain-containing protein [bacterium]|nr:PKD domain-containing protein [bacterium]
MARLLRILAASGSALLLVACGGHARNAAPVQAQASPSASLQSALAELQQLEAPAGVDRRLFERLKSALADKLLACGSKSARTAPTGEANKVTDLTIWSEDEQLRLMWHYRNAGDYDQDGTVGISDITPLAIHYDEVWGDTNSIQAVVDGSGNHKIGIEDITPIAQYYGVDCAGYTLQNSPVPDPEDPRWNSVGAYDFSLASGIGRFSFVVSAEVGEYPYYRVVPYDSSSVVGVPGEVVEFVPRPPEIAGVNPLSGVSGDAVTFTATATGELPMTYRWNFGGGAIPNQPSGSSVTVTLSDPGFYDANVTVTNGAGQDDYPFTLEVTEPVIDPPDIESVSPLNGQEGTYVEFSAVVTGGPPLAYRWDFGGGANPDTPVDESPEVLLLDPGEYEASLRVTNPVDEDIYPFTLEVLPAGTESKVVVAGVTAEHPSMVVADGNPAIAFTKTGDGGNAVCYVRATDALGSAWGEYQEYAGDGATYTNNLLQIVGGKPAGVSSVSFMIKGGRIDFASAEDSAGDVWNAVVSVYDDFQIKPTAAGLMDVMGNPAIAFSNDDTENYKLLYVRANDSAGTDWPETYVEVASLENASYAQTSMVFADGNPAILHTWWTGAIYVRSKDMYGNEWDTPTDLATMSARSSMTLIGNNPAVAIETGGELPHALIYRRALDPAGASWGDPVTVVSSEGEGVVGSGGRICLAEINKRPAIAYGHTPGTIWYFVKYVVAKDNEGKEWNEPVTVDPATDVSDGITLSEIAGRPAMAYGNRVGEELIYIRANDEYGLEWPE